MGWGPEVEHSIIDHGGSRKRNIPSQTRGKPDVERSIIDGGKPEVEYSIID